MALNVNIIGKDSEGNLRALKVNSEGNLDFGQLETEIQAVKDNQGRLYGKYGEAWIPVKVDSEGRPIISSDVTVNAEGMVVDLGQIKQGPAGTEPWPVQLSGTIAEVVKVVDALAITTTSTRYITFPFSLTRYRDWDLFVTNTLDVECRVGFTDSPASNSIHVIAESGEVVSYNPGDRFNDANYKVNDTMNNVRLSTLPMTTKIPDPAEYKKLSAFIKNIAIRANIAPTEGAITITLVGWY